ncbi:MAG TPA: hypothetical protein VN843_31890 [Anaerolineales bacterium]|nr:hypothetical protein [Anaerolineales bacterium]
MLFLDFMGMTGLAPIEAFVVIIAIAYWVFRSTYKKSEASKEPHKHTPFDGGSVF